MQKLAAIERFLACLQELAHTLDMDISDVYKAFGVGSRYIFASSDSTGGMQKARTQQMVWHRKKANMRHELDLITSAFHQNGIRFVLIKGFHLADLLGNENLERTFSDIDLLVDPAHIKEAIQILLGMDYTGAFSSDVNDILGYYRSGLRSWIANGMHHAAGLSKKINSKGSEVSVELHISPSVASWEIYGQNRYPSEQFERYWGRAVYDGCLNCRCLSLEDCWIEVILHLVNNHITMPVTRYLYGHPFTEDTISYPLDLLTDIALFFFRFGDALDWGYIADYSLKDDRILAYQFVGRLLNEGFHLKLALPEKDSFAPDQLNRLNHYAQVLYLLQDITLEQMLKGNIFDHLHNALNILPPQGVLSAGKRYHICSSLSELETWIEEQEGQWALHLSLPEPMAAAKDLLIMLYFGQGTGFSRELYISPKHPGRSMTTKDVWEVILDGYNEWVESWPYPHEILREDGNVHIVVTFPLCEQPFIGLEIKTAEDFNGYAEKDIFQHYAYQFSR